MTGYRYIDEGRQHLHTLEGKPLLGTSTICKIVGGSEGLITWAANCAVDYIKGEHTAIVEEGREGFDRICEEARKAHIRKRDASAEKGTERHTALEEYVQTCLTSRNGQPIDAGDDDTSIRQFIDWSLENVERFLFTEANCASARLHVGGIADIGMLLKDGRRVVGDHKSSPKAYFNHFLQTAVYDLLLSESGGMNAEGEKQFDWEPADGYVIFPFRSKPFQPEFRWDANEWRKAAEEVVHIYKLSNN